MRKNRGRRYNTEPKLNMKKVVATIIAFLGLVMVIVSIVMLVKQSKKQELNSEKISYFTLYTNDKWGVINSKGEEVIPASYNDMIFIPNKDKGLFVVTYDVDYTAGEGKTKVLNEKNQEILTQYSNIYPIDNYISSDEVWYEDNVLKYKKDGKYGLIDFDGKEILPAEYNDIATVKGIERSILIYKDGKVGLFNNISQDITIEPKYKEIRALGSTYNDGYIVVDENNKAGIIGPDKKVILENKYDDIANIFGNNMYIVKNGDVITVINSDGTVILDSGFDEIKSINGDNIIIKKDGKYGVVNTKKENVIGLNYEDLGYVLGDLYIAKSNGKYGVINTAGETKIDFKYEKISYKKDVGILECDKEDYTSDIFNRDCEFKLNGTISKTDATAGYLRIRVGEEIKYYNLNFEEKSNRDVLPNNTLFLVKKDGKYGYVNKDNKQIVDCIYDDAMEQNEFGFCAVKKDGKWGVLKSDGAVLLEPSVELKDNLYVDFIGKWHLSDNLELNTYTDK